jgi:NitT/TauT family transport system substrate-binding protein
MVHKDSGVYRMQDLRGKRVAVPEPLSNQRCCSSSALKTGRDDVSDIEIVEMPPPDMPPRSTRRQSTRSRRRAVHGADRARRLRPRAVTHEGRVAELHLVRARGARGRDQQNREAVQQLVDGIASSGSGSTSSMDHRMHAAQFVAEHYYNQNPRLLRYVLSKPPDRVKYTNLSLRKKDFEEIEQLGIESGILQGTAHFEDYTDASFVPDDSVVKPHAWQGLKK